MANMTMASPVLTLPVINTLLQKKDWPLKTILQFFSLCTDTMEQAVEDYEFIDIPVHVTSDFGPFKIITYFEYFTF